MTDLIINVNLEVLRNILGSETFYFKYHGNLPITPGSLVCFRLQPSLKSHRTVLFCYRYIVAMENLFALHLDDYSATLILSPFKPSL
jgi:hypothetical protein